MLCSVAAASLIPGKQPGETKPWLTVLFISMDRSSMVHVWQINYLERANKAADSEKPANNAW